MQANKSPTRSLPDHPCVIHPQRESVAVLDNIGNRILLGPIAQTLSTNFAIRNQQYPMCNVCFRRFCKYLPTVDGMI